MNRAYHILCLLSVSLLSTNLWSTENEDAPKIDFARQVLPILSDKCFVCHGPDSDETDLRLDSLEAATSDLGGYRAIDIHAPAESEILKRIFSDDDPMPPSDAEKQITDGERKVIQKWIQQGGDYAKHWAFVPPQKSTKYSSTTDAIDSLIAKQLREKLIGFSPQADRAVLARRAALVLTGLPPEPEQLAEFLSDQSETAYADFVDLLMASPRFGEHQARYWLDAVRYGDTHGLHLDNRRGIYPYRDWVVRAINSNLPWDEFIRWQLAGDLLSEPTLDQQVATGYVRLNPSTGEGGAIADEFQVKNNFDRVETLGTVFLGMSLNCARCHNHKYDPIPQTEYYRLLAFFNSTAEPALDGNSYTYGSHIRTPSTQRGWEQWQPLQQARSSLLAEASLAKPLLQQAVAYAKATKGWSTSKWRISKPAANNGVIPDESKWSDAKGFPGLVTARKIRTGLASADQVNWVSFEVKTPKSQTIDIAFSGAVGSRVYVGTNNIPVAEKNESAALTHASIRLSSGTHTVRIAIVGESNPTDIQVDHSNRWESLANSGQWKDCSPRDQLRMLAAPNGPFRRHSQHKAAQALDQEIDDIERDFTTTLVAKELPKPRDTFVLTRGEYDMPSGEALQPGILEVMGTFPRHSPRNRLGLADWLTSENHPLVSRVLVNRIWQRVFGDGLVRTPEDFGLQGQQPTHPELLDWLSVDFREQGWDLKRLIRSMVTSKTFQQSAVWREDVEDPENRLFARGAGYRLDAEVLRDIGLWASGLLNPTMGGEGVKPYQPTGMWSALAHPASNTKQYQRDQGRSLYRRSLYVYWKRTSPHPMMTLFDAPDRESSCVRRSRTNTPLQSLGMLNETQRIEMARSLARRLILSRENDQQRIHFLFRLLACRDAKTQEMKACEELLHSMHLRYQASKDDAIALLSLGDAPREETIDLGEHAAWTQLAATVLASDVAILLY